MNPADPPADAALSVHTVARQWRTLLGPNPRIDASLPGRELWPVTAEDGRRYLLKRLGPWLNLPVADQARVLIHLASRGIVVAEFQIADDARLVAGGSEDNIVLIPHLEHDRIVPSQSLEVESAIGGAIARLHTALASYPWPANSYREQIVENLEGDLLLPEDVRELFMRRQLSIIDALEPLPLQLVHGDLTPDNILVGRDLYTVAFIDLDHLPLAPRVWDLGKHLSRYLRRLPPAAAFARISQLVRGYHRTSILSEVEIAAVPSAIAAMQLLEVSWTQNILSGRLERRLLPAQAAELGPTLEALRYQLRDGRGLAGAIRSGIDAAVVDVATTKGAVSTVGAG